MCLCVPGVAAVEPMMQCSVAPTAATPRQIVITTQAPALTQHVPQISLHQLQQVHYVTVLYFSLDKIRKLFCLPSPDCCKVINSHWNSPVFTQQFSLFSQSFSLLDSN